MVINMMLVCYYECCCEGVWSGNDDKSDIIRNGELTREEMKYAGNVAKQEVLDECNPNLHV